MKTIKHSKEYDEALNLFVGYWGEMSSKWGINKTMAQIYALLFAIKEPLDTDTIMEELSISRGNANMNLRNLIEWGLIHKVQIEGKRKDFYASETDIWNMAAKIINQRQLEEVAPIKKTLTDCKAVLDSAEEPSPEVKEFQHRLDSFLTFLNLFNDFAEAVLPYITEKNVDQIKSIVEMAKMSKMQEDQYRNGIGNSSSK